MGGSSSQPRTDPAMSPINAFPVEELYSPQFSDSFQENIGYWQEPTPHESPVEQVAASPTKKKKATCNRQKMTIQSDDAPRQTPWTTEEEITLAKGWLVVYEARRQTSFWYEVLQSGDGDYVEKAMVHYELETGLPFRLRHCWEILKDRPKWQEVALPNFATESGGSKRHKAFGSSSDKARSARKNKGSKASGSSTLNEDALARLMVIEMTAQENEQLENS
ncbi:hypothetical protein Tco_0528171 [Tanacetum coccineum]